MRLKKHRSRQALSNGKHCRVEPFKVARLDDAVFFRPFDKIIRLLKCCSQRFFNQQVDAGVKQFGRNGMMVHGWHGDGGGVEIEIGGEKFFDRGKNRNLVLSCSFLGASPIGFDRGNQRYAFTGQFQFAIDPEMIAAECARARNGNAQLACTGYFAASFSFGASGDFP
jgi:hypothetical protein